MAAAGTDVQCSTGLEVCHRGGVALSSQWRSNRCRGQRGWPARARGSGPEPRKRLARCQSRCRVALSLQREGRQCEPRYRQTVIGPDAKQERRGPSYGGPHDWNRRHPQGICGAASISMPAVKIIVGHGTPKAGILEMLRCSTALMPGTATST